MPTFCRASAPERCGCARSTGRRSSSSASARRRFCGGRVPVVGSGHPLADVMLLKYRPQPSEVQEGVAFFGRAGEAILKSLRRLHVDPMSVYGTNCVKFADGDDGESR